MLSLESLQWQEFRISDVFEVINAKPYHKTNLKINTGRTPYITRTSLNNGLEAIVLNEDFVINPKNTISLGAENADFFYQDIEYLAGNKMYYLSNENINRYTGLFLVQALQKSIQNCGFGYGKGLTGTRLKNRKILLPIDSKGQPHWEFMESFMRKIEKDTITKVLEYYQNKPLSNGGGGGTYPLCNKDSYTTVSYQTDSCHTDSHSTESKWLSFLEDSLMQIATQNLALQELQWSEFRIEDIFDITATLSGIDKNKLNGKKGQYPYITRTDKQNGIDDFIAMQNNYKLNQGNVITIGLDTQTAFYQKTPFYTGQNIQILSNEKLNMYNALFILKPLKMLMEKFSWGSNGATLTRLKRSIILLPIDSKGQPHWDFMESFMKDLESKHIQKILAYYNHKSQSITTGVGWEQTLITNSINTK